MTTRRVRLPDELDEKLAALAQANHTSVNSTIIRAVEDLVGRRAQQDAIDIASDIASDIVFTSRADLFARLADA